MHQVYVQMESAVTIPEWQLYVPVDCSEAGTQYHGVRYMEPISRITEVNGSNLTNLDFKTGDVVKVKYNKLYTGVEDLLQDKEHLVTSVSTAALLSDIESVDDDTCKYSCCYMGGGVILGSCFPQLHMQVTISTGCCQPSEVG